MNKSEPSGCLGRVAGMLLGFFGAESRGNLPARLPYRRRDWLFTKAERSFYGVLEEAIGSRGRIFAKVCLRDLLWIPRGTDQRQTLQNKIDKKHIDFVVCSLDEVRPLLAIELDDSSHELEDRRKRDGFLDAAMAAAGLPLLRVPVRTAYNVSELRRQIDDALALSGARL